MNEIVIHQMTTADWPRVKQIYLEGIATGHATFETGAPTFAEWNQAHLSCARLVAQQGDATVGWAALSPVSQRCVYGGVAEVRVYVSASKPGSGIGRQLPQGLINQSEQTGTRTTPDGRIPGK